MRAPGSSAERLSQAAAVRARFAAMTSGAKYSTLRRDPRARQSLADLPNPQIVPTAAQTMTAGAVAEGEGAPTLPGRWPQAGWDPAWPMP